MYLYRKKWYTLLSSTLYVTCCILILSFTEKWKHSQEKNISTKHKAEIDSSNQRMLFQKMVVNLADQNIIILSLTDNYYIELAFNFYYSLSQFNVSNYIIVSTHQKAFDSLLAKNIR